MIQHCVNCDRPMHLRGGDMTTTCAECRLREENEKQKPFAPDSWYRALSDAKTGSSIAAGPLPRSEPHDLDARALRARLEDRERYIATLLDNYAEQIKRAEAAEAALKVMKLDIPIPDKLMGELIWRNTDLNAEIVPLRELKAKLEDRERVIAAFRERCQKLEAVAEAARTYAYCDDPFLSMPPRPCDQCEGCKLRDALAALDAKEVG